MVLQHCWGRDNPSLRCSAEGTIIFPFFQISCLQETFDQVQESAIVDRFSEYRQQDPVVDVVEASFDVSLDEPFRTCPYVMDFGKGCLTAFVASEAVRVSAELGLEVCFQDGSHDFLQQFIGPRGDAQRACLAVGLWDVNPSDGGPSIAFLAQEVNDRVDFPQRHSIDGFLGTPLGHGPVVTVDASISPEEQFLGV